MNGFFLYPRSQQKVPLVSVQNCCCLNLGLSKSLIGTDDGLKIGQLAQVFQCQGISKMHQDAVLGFRQFLDFIQESLLHTKLI